MIVNKIETGRKSIGLASDHAGYVLKERIKEFLKGRGYEVTDFGTDSEESVDYPDFAHLLARSLNQGKVNMGVVICGSGNGVNMTVNRYKGIRAALCWGPEIAEVSRRHNDANVLSLPGRYIGEKEAVEIVEKFLNTSFEGGRHERRVMKIDKKKHCCPTKK